MVDYVTGGGWFEHYALLLKYDAVSGQGFFD
jgi:hypothetical protein